MQQTIIRMINRIAIDENRRRRRRRGDSENDERTDADTTKTPIIIVPTIIIQRQRRRRRRQKPQQTTIRSCTNQNSHPSSSDSLRLLLSHIPRLLLILTIIAVEVEAFQSSSASASASSASASSAVFEHYRYRLDNGNKYSDDIAAVVTFGSSGGTTGKCGARRAQNVVFLLQAKSRDGDSNKNGKREPKEEAEDEDGGGSDGGNFFSNFMSRSPSDNDEPEDEPAANDGEDGKSFFQLFGRNKDTVDDESNDGTVTTGDDNESSGQGEGLFRFLGKGNKDEETDDDDKKKKRGKKDRKDEGEDEVENDGDGFLKGITKRFGGGGGGGGKDENKKNITSSAKEETRNETDLFSSIDFRPTFITFQRNTSQTVQVPPKGKTYSLPPQVKSTTKTNKTPAPAPRQPQQQQQQQQDSNKTPISPSQLISSTIETANEKVPANPIPVTEPTATLSSSSSASSSSSQKPKPKKKSNSTTTITSRSGKEKKKNEKKEKEKQQPAQDEEEDESISLFGKMQRVFGNFTFGSSDDNNKKDDEKTRNIAATKKSNSTSFTTSPRSVASKFISNLWETSRTKFSEVTSNNSNGKNSGREEWVPVCPKTRITPGEIVPVEVAGLDLIVVASKDAQNIYCMVNSCPHLGTPLETGFLERRPIETNAGDIAYPSSLRKQQSTPPPSPPKQIQESDVAAMLTNDGCEDCIVCPLHRTAFALKSGQVRGEWCPYPPVLGKMMAAVKQANSAAVFDVRTRGKNIEVRLNTPILLQQEMDNNTSDDKRKKKKKNESKEGEEE